MSGDRLQLPVVRDPVVSIVMVCFGGHEWVKRSTAAVIAHTPACYEMVFVDNGSSDATVPFIRDRVVNARLLCNDANRGFGVAANQGAVAATAPLILYLNSDAIVGPGWLAPLQQEFERDPTLGAASPMVLNLDGSLQDAGPFVFATGSTFSYGEGVAPRYEWAFARVVDYANGACMLVGRTAFEAVGGFDPVYSPAYFEDADLCFAMAARGHLSRFVPDSVIRHASGASGAGLDLRPYAARNREVFRRRFCARLAGRPEGDGSPNARVRVAARDALAAVRVLVVAPLANDDWRRILSTAARRWPTVRYTALATSAVAGDVTLALSRAGVEVPDVSPHEWTSWLESRAFHYDACLIDATAPRPQIDAALARSHSGSVHDVALVPPAESNRRGRWRKRLPVARPRSDAMLDTFTAAMARLGAPPPCS